jgi:hypothetical protein
MQVKDGYSGRLDIDQDIGEAVMLATVLIAANMCLQGGGARDWNPRGLFAGLRGATGAVYGSRIIRLDSLCGTRAVRSG